MAHSHFQRALLAWLHCRAISMGDMTSLHNPTFILLAILSAKRVYLGIAGSMCEPISLLFFPPPPDKWQQRASVLFWGVQQFLEPVSCFPSSSCVCELGSNICMTPAHFAGRLQPGLKTHLIFKRYEKAWWKVEILLVLGEIILRQYSVFCYTGILLHGWGHILR